MLFETAFVRLPLNTMGRDFLVGDLHGQKPLMDRALELIRFNPDHDRLIALGDLVDRGPGSEALLHLVRDAPWFISLRGNHEAMLFESTQDWDARRIWNRNQNEWARSLSDVQVKALARIVEGLPLAIELPLPDGRRIGLVHAEVHTSCAWDDLRDIAYQPGDGLDDYASTVAASLLWARRRLIAWARVLTAAGPDPGDLRTQVTTWNNLQPIAGIDRVVTGHSVLAQHKPLAVGNLLYIETGAFLPEGRLTIVEIARDHYWQVAHTDLSTPVRRRRPKLLPKPNEIPERWRPADVDSKPDHSQE